MFGYVVINKPELKIKDYERYQSFYCGLCRSLKRRYGKIGTLTLSYDLTLAAILLTALYEPETVTATFRCVSHPLTKHTALTNRFTDYAADMNLLMAYEKALDDVKDEGKLRSRLLAAMLKPKAEKVAALYPQKAAAIKWELVQLSAAEQRGETDIDTVSGCFGRIMAEVFAVDEPLWTEDLRRFGFFLGKFIYLLDAYDDLSADLKNGCYNPLAEKKEHPDFHRETEDLLELMMSEAARSFERLPILQDTEILRNIIYGGVWLKFYARKKKEQKDDE